jgi:hypothetical protein
VNAGWLLVILQCIASLAFIIFAAFVGALHEPLVVASVGTQGFIIGLTIGMVRST